MTTDGRTLSLLVHAASKMGKTTLASTAPLPLLALDAEGGWKFIPSSPTLIEMYGRPLRVVQWDPKRYAPPQYDGTWEICQVVAHDFETVTRTHEWLTQYPHQFVSIAVDSISEIQRRCKQNLVGTTGNMQRDNWNQILSIMDAIIRGIRDMTLQPQSSVRCVVFIAETRQRASDNKYVPYMQGQIGIALPYWMDVEGYMYVEQSLDANGQLNGQLVRKLLVSPHDPQYEAGERVQGRLGTVIEWPNVTRMFQQIYPEEAMA